MKYLVYISQRLITGNLARRTIFAIESVQPKHLRIICFPVQEKIYISMNILTYYEISVG